MNLKIDHYNNVFSVADDEQKQYAGIVRNGEIGFGTPLVKISAQGIPVMNGKAGSFLIGTDYLGGVGR